MMHYHRLIPIIFIRLLCLCLPVHSQKEEFKISGYLPDYRSYINVNATSTHLTDLILFSITPETLMGTGKGEGCCVKEDHYDLIRQARNYKKETQNKELRLILTVGGAGRSDGFSEVLNGGLKSLRKFTDELVNLCKKEQLDGIDLDYEGLASADEGRKYMKLLVFLGDHFQRNNLKLSVALHPGQFLQPQVCRMVDHVHVMTYDMIERDDKIRKPGHHAKLPTVKDEIQGFIKAGCSASKIVLGIPAYARHGENPGLVKTYSEIMDEYFAYRQTTDSNYEAMGEMDGYYFDSPNAVRSKVKYAKEAGLGGVFFWELGQDKQHPGHEGGILLDAAASKADSSKEEL